MASQEVSDATRRAGLLGSTPEDTYAQVRDHLLDPETHDAFPEEIEGLTLDELQGFHFADHGEDATP